MANYVMTDKALRKMAQNGLSEGQVLDASIMVLWNNGVTEKVMIV